MRIGDPLTIDGAELESVEYYFQNNRLMGIDIVGKRHEEMMDVARATYGDSKAATVTDGALVFVDLERTATACMVIDEGMKGRLRLTEAGLPKSQDGRNHGAE